VLVFISFSHQESFEAWANLGGVHMRMRHWPQAFCALDEAIKLSRSNWRLWQNYLYTALSSDHITAAVDAAENLLELQVGISSKYTFLSLTC
jgi:cytochrome c-type biogenesis protein CcmH/NrfG